MYAFAVGIDGEFVVVIMSMNGVLHQANFIIVAAKCKRTLNRKEMLDRITS